MSKWVSKSGRFGKEEIIKIREYLQREGASKNVLVKRAVFDVIAKNIDVNNYLQNRDGDFSAVLVSRFREEDLDKVNIYLQTFSMSMSDLVRGSVLYYVDNAISLGNNVNNYLQREIPGVDDIVSVLIEIAEKTGSSTVKNATRPKAWRVMFSETSNIEKLGSLFWKRIMKRVIGGYIPNLTEFEAAISEEYPGLFVDAINAVRIQELRRAIKLKLRIDTDIFDGLLIKLFESGKYKIEEGSGEGGLRYRGRNFMFLRKVQN